MNFEVQPMRLCHIRDLVLNLRAGDRLECEALGLTPIKAICQAYNEAVTKSIVLLNGKVAAAWGLSGTILGQVGHPWLLTSTEVNKAPIGMAGVYRREVRKMLELYPMLENWCDSRYTKSLRLLELAGFKVEAPEPYGPNNFLFCRFWLEAVYVQS